MILQHRWSVSVIWSSHANTRTLICENKALGSRLSRPGSPLAALSQLRRREAEWEGWLTEVERMGGEEKGGRDGEIFSRTSVIGSDLCAAFFTASSVTCRFPLA